jgi:hypothetical protein
MGPDELKGWNGSDTPWGYDDGYPTDQEVRKGIWVWLALLLLITACIVLL